MEDMQNKALEILKGKKFNTFKVSAQRSEKSFKLNSQQINEKIGEYIIDNLNKKVDLSNPDITIYIEVVEKYCFMYTEKKKSLAGLPVGVSGKAVSLISGGIDSPVASFLAMKRGLELTYLHFHSMPFSDQASIDKVKDIANLLNKFQGTSKMCLVPFADIQKEILIKTPQKLRVLLYRRMMIRIAEQIAIKEKCKSIVTGENLAQVASQTIENLTVIEKATDLIVLRPVLTNDKQEIIEKAKELDTYNISIIPHHDCCARFLPKHPETRANLKEVEDAESKLDIETLISQATQKALFYSCL